MPAILEQGGIDRWMADDADMDTVLSLLKPYAGNDLSVTKVSTRVNSTRYRDPDCIEG